MADLTPQSSSQPIGATKRIEFIDALRGFTMILVVLNHVSYYCLGIDNKIPSFHKYLIEIQMPLFFFISGFVLYKPTSRWDNKHMVSFFKSKIPVLLISPLIFMSIYFFINHIPFIEGIYEDAKYGYWFTFVLFVFFVYYAITRYILNLLKIDNIYSDLLILLLGFTFFFVNYLPLSIKTQHLLSTGNLYYYIFFVIGTLSRKHYKKLQEILDKTPLIIIAIVIFFLFNIFEKEIHLSTSMILLFLTFLSGVIIVFALFRNKQQYLTKETILGNSLQYIGKRTLDIYLLHFFFLPVALKNTIASSLTTHPVPVIELAISLTIALVIIACTLVISNILRLSPILGHYLFGAKRPVKPTNEHVEER